MSDDWLFMAATDLGRGIEAGKINPLDLTKAYLKAIKAHPLRDRIYVRLTEDRAIAEATAAAERAKKGQRLSLLDGVPISWKDLFDTTGVATESGSALLEGRTPDRDAVVLQNATAAGLVCLGKTHMSELAFSGLGYNPVTQTPPSVNDANSVAGGSSSGAAASVAFGLAAAAVGSDTGGSVRIPSAWNDLVGLKTTSGRLSLKGVVPLAAKFDTVGPLCRTVEDAAHLFLAMEGNSNVDLVGADLSGTRLLIPETLAMDNVRDEPKQGFEHAVSQLKACGAKIETAPIDEINSAMSLAGVLYTSEAYATWKDVIESAPDKMFAEILERFRNGGSYSAVEYIQACQTLDGIRGIWETKTAGFDAVIMPTSPILPPNIERLALDHDYYVTENLLALRNTRIGNLMGSACVTLPTGTPSAGIMFLSSPNTEEKLLRLAAAVESALA